MTFIIHSQLQTLFESKLQIQERHSQVLVQSCLLLQAVLILRGDIDIIGGISPSKACRNT